jgi:p-cumate 2,3-dioxygenase alpha subunit
MSVSTEFKDLVVEVAGSDFRVHRSVFTSDDVLRRERDTIFNTSWLYVGHLSEIRGNGDYVTRTIGGEPIILSRDRNAAVHVFYNSCRHRGALVCRDQVGNAANFRCFYHMWTYRDSGELVGVADKVSFPPSLNLAETGLLSPRFDIYRDFVFLTFSDTAPPLLDYLGEVRTYLDLIIDQSPTGDMEVVHGSHLYSQGGNWKLIVENSIDGYHALQVHATYLQYMVNQGYDFRGGLQGVGRALGNGHAIMEFSAPNGRSSAKWAEPMGADLREPIEAVEAAIVDKHGAETARRITQMSKNIFVYPNLVIIDAASLQIRILDPVSPGYTEASAWALAPVGEDPDLRRHRLTGYLEFLGPGGLATPDDNEAIESCQAGYGRLHGVEWSIVSKGITKETPTTIDEEQIRGFWRQWQQDIVNAVEPAGGVRQ